MTAKRLGLGIIGGGGAFGRFIASALPLVPGLELRAVAGSNEARTRKAAADLRLDRWTIRYQELIDDPAVDLVIVATPPSLHAEMAMAVAASGKAVFIEKPVATAVEDGLALLRSVREQGVVAGVDYVMRYSPIYRAAQGIARDGALGRLRRVAFRNDAGDEGLAADHWFWDRAKSGGILVEHGVHFFDVYGWLIGAAPESVHGLSLMRDGGPQQDVVHADVQYANGVLGSYTHAFDKPSRLESQEGLLVFDRGYLRIAGWTPTRLELHGLVSDAEADRLRSISDLTLETVARFDGDARRMRGRGQDFAVQQEVRGVLAPAEDSQELYRRAVAAALGDLVRALREPGHRPAVRLEDGVVSLAVACVAAGTASGTDLERVLAEVGPTG